MTCYSAVLYKHSVINYYFIQSRYINQVVVWRKRLISPYSLFCSQLRSSPLLAGLPEATSLWQLSRLQPKALYEDVYPAAGDCSGISHRHNVTEERTTLKPKMLLISVAISWQNDWIRERLSLPLIYHQHSSWPTEPFPSPLQSQQNVLCSSRQILANFSSSFNLIFAQFHSSHINMSPGQILSPISVWLEQ